MWRNGVCVVVAMVLACSITVPLQLPAPAALAVGVVLGFVSTGVAAWWNDRSAS